MNDGIRIIGQPNFAQLFTPIFADISGLFWITHPEPFSLPALWADQSEFDETTEEYTSWPDAELDRAVVEVSEDRGRKFGFERKSQYGFYSSTDLFPRFAKAVSEDWNAIFGLQVPVDPLAWLKRYYDAKDRAGYVLDSSTAVCFLNIDAAFWEFYARDMCLQGKLRTHLGNLDVSVKPCRLTESNGL